MSSFLEEYIVSQKPNPVFMPYLSLGDPGYNESILFAETLCKFGGDILELGIPFSDPVADGPVIQKSYRRALDNHPFSMKTIMDTTARIHTLISGKPIVFLTYLNPILAYGMKEFFQDAHRSGVRGIVVPDIPFDSKDYKMLFTEAEKAKISLITMITPATKPSRIRSMKKYASGFVYYVTSFGVTGVRTEFSLNLEERINMVREILNIPVLAGFGISTPDQAREISKISDGIIIGSAIQKIIESNISSSENCRIELSDYAGVIKKSILE
ncbi:MAG: tryptophan synthase subunit alpha [Leptospiraceae bacterium]|nr:tryptophan synthase subunit alpha [Leptospiraceae bacterium]MCP5513452.1 tryptophan synthase subunit alpha [Leptospiraceae bacterium]